MSITTIATGQDIATLINVFTVTPDKGQALLDLLVAATDEVIKDRPGFISANFHVSLDRTRVVNYAQWRSREDLQAMLDDPAAKEHMAAAAALATFEPNLYEVVSVHHA